MHLFVCHLMLIPFRNLNDDEISQDQMTADLDISRRTISKIENGEQNPSLDMVYRIAAYFNLLIPEVFPLAKEIHLASFEEYSEK